METRIDERGAAGLDEAGGTSNLETGISWQRRLSQEAPSFTRGSSHHIAHQVRAPPARIRCHQTSFAPLHSRAASPAGFPHSQARAPTAQDAPERTRLRLVPCARMGPLAVVGEPDARRDPQRRTHSRSPPWPSAPRDSLPTPAFRTWP